MKTRNIFIETLWNVIKDNYVTEEKRLSHAKKAIDAIIAIQPIYETFKKNNPEIKLKDCDEINLNVLSTTQESFLQFADFNNHIEIVKVLLESKADPNYPSAEPPITLAASRGHTEIVESLLENSADPNLPCQYTGYSAIYHAIKDNRVELLQKLLAKNANVNLKTCKDGLTPLIIAAKMGNTEITKILLLDNNADPNMPDDDGDTPLMWAAYNGEPAIIEILILDRRTKLELKNKALRTALDESLNNKTPHLQTVTLLLSINCHINDPEELFNYLKDCDQRETDVLISLKYLCNQLKLRLDTITSLDHEHELNNELIENANIYLEKLQKLSDTHRHECDEMVDKATLHSLPKDILNVISGYQTPLERLSFFKADEIDKISSNKQNDKAKTSKQKCVIM